MTITSRPSTPKYRANWESIFGEGGVLFPFDDKDVDLIEDLELFTRALRILQELETTTSSEESYCPSCGMNATLDEVQSHTTDCELQKLLVDLEERVSR